LAILPMAIVTSCMSSDKVKYATKCIAQTCQDTKIVFDMNAIILCVDYKMGDGFDHLQQTILSIAIIIITH